MQPAQRQGCANPVEGETLLGQNSQHNCLPAVNTQLMLTESFDVRNSSTPFIASRMREQDMTVLSKKSMLTQKGRYVQCFFLFYSIK